MKPDSPKILISIRDLQDNNIVKLDPILREHVRAHDTGQVIESEVEAIKSYMRGLPDSEERIRKFFVAVDNSECVLGCMAVATPDADMIRHFSTDIYSSMELLNAFVRSESFRGNGVGKQLFQRVCDYAKEQGAINLIVHSGPRYQKSWGFYDRVCDASKGFIENKYGSGRHAKTWIKALNHNVTPQQSS